MWNWIQKHPQRVTGLLLGVFASLQGSLAMFQSAIPPLWNAGITTLFAVLITGLAWLKDVFKDDNETPGE